MSIGALQETSYSVTRLTVDVPCSFEHFRGQYEQAVPPEPSEKVDALIAQGAPWSAMNDLIASAAPFGFLIYWKNDAHKVMRLSRRHRRGNLLPHGQPHDRRDHV